MDWVERRKGYRYSGFVFADEGCRARGGGVEYEEREFPAGVRKKFNYWLVAVLLIIFPGIPLLASAGIRGWWLGVVLLPWMVFVLSTHRRIHRCPGCGGVSRELRTPHHASPVLYLCPRCRTFFEHGQIDGGWPWK